MKNKLKLNLLMLSVILLSLLVWSNLALASEVTGNLTTGIGTAVEGIVITPPIASPGAGAYTSAQSVALSASGASSIRYTTDGTAPTCSTGTVYSGPISVGSSMAIETISCYPNNKVSTVASYAYTITIPAPTPALAPAPVSSGSGGGGGGGGGGYYPQTPTPTAPVPTPALPSGQVLGATAFNFASALSLSSRGNDVTELQNRLTAEGVYSGPITGYFGPLTLAGVKAYQLKHGLPGTGFVGPLTRAQLNGAQAGGGVLGVSTSAGAEALRAQIAGLQAQLVILLQKLVETLRANATGQ